MGLDDLSPKERADRAQQLLDCPIFNQAFNAARAECLQHFEQSGLLETEVRETAYHRLTAIDAIRSSVRQHVADYMLCQEEG